MSTMMAVLARVHGGPDVLEPVEVPVPSPGPREALVEIRACSINHLDIWVREGRRGHHDLEIKLPRVLGSDVAGIVRELGPGDGLPAVAVGQHVLVCPARGCGRCAMCIRGRENSCGHYDTLGVDRDGGYAQFVTVSIEDIVPKPEHLDFVEAACLPLAYMTAWHMLVGKGRLRPGETVLVNAGASGVGSAAVQIASGLGARVIATASTPEKLQKARDMGAAEVIRYDANPMWPEVARITGGSGVDVVVDSVGGDVFEQSLRCAAMGGRVVNCGATAGEDVALDLHAVRAKRLELLFSVMGSRSDLYESLDFVSSRTLRPLVNRALPLTDAVAAHRALSERGTWGKVVLQPA
jgi:NADPH:quinone reductase-like Zn-dependent oxidoreductase